MANKYFENYPAPADIDAYGVDLVHPTTHKVIENYRTYWQARDARDSIVEDNAKKKRDYEAACKYRSDIIHENTTRDLLHQIPVPDMPKKPRLTAVPTLKWYEPGKAPVPADTEVAAT